MEPKFQIRKKITANITAIIISFVFSVLGVAFITVCIIEDLLISALILGVAITLLGIISGVVKIIEPMMYQVLFYDRKIIEHSGVVVVKEKENIFNVINSITLTQSVLGKKLNYGTVTLEVDMGTVIVFENIYAPWELQKYLDINSSI